MEICEELIGKLLGNPLDARLFQGDMVLMPLFAAIAGVLMLFLFQWWFKDDFRGCYSGKWIDKGMRIPFLIVVAAALGIILEGYIVNGIKAPTLTAITGSLMAGIVEEVAFRMIPISLAMRRGSEKKNICIAIIVSTILFGLIHVGNISAGQSAVGTLLQVVNAIGLGVFLGAIYLRTGNLLITMIYHTVYDFLVFLQAGADGLIVDMGKTATVDNAFMLVFTVITFGCGLWLLKGSSQTIAEVWDDRWSRSSL